ncbi:MAG TPA: tRNA lysidine(34) synthetase TilS [Alphaproteobacteria bacterium]|nr:tRNA lysidine(34) synthetase TilS [Alphaproteobacteria bacterium]
MTEAARGDARAVDATTFAAALGALGPFEPDPVLAVAVSGGADSMALALLADVWARKRGGHVVALTVDHGLRRESADEARAVGRWMAEHGIAHVVLTWRHDSDETDGLANLQARARAARYRLMTGWCLAHGVLHLLLAHHRDDQAETLLLRLGRGSGVDGLAAMAPIAETHGVRLLRPLLAIPRASLEATLRRAGQDWVEDSSNSNRSFARVRLRALAPVLAGEGMTNERLGATAARLRRARETLELVTGEFLARAATPFEEGYVRLDAASLRTAPEEIALRVVARIVAAVGGLAYVPRREGSEALLGRLVAGDRAPGAGKADTVLGTLGGVMAVRTRAGELLFVREPAAIGAPAPVTGPGEYEWDGRFRIRVRLSTRGRVLAIGALGEASARRLVGEGGPDGLWLDRLPRRVRGTLPALTDRSGRVVALPTFGYGRPDGGTGTVGHGKREISAYFAPSLPLVGPGFLAGSQAGFMLV